MARSIIASVVAISTLSLGLFAPFTGQPDAASAAEASDHETSRPVGAKLPPRPTGKAERPTWKAVPPDAEEIPLVAGQVVCVLTCDGGDPADTSTSSRPVDAVRMHGRVLELATSLPDVVGWAVVGNAEPGDRLWTERSFDGGATREQTVEPTTAEEDGEATTATMNLTDPGQHRRGVVRACLEIAGEADCTDWAYRSVCDEVCDGAEPVGTPTDAPVPERTVDNRTVRLTFDEVGSGVARVDDAVAGDEVWIERSWNQGVSAPGGNFLGRTAVPEGGSGASTVGFVAAEPRLKMAGGTLRACARAGEQTGCTGWARPAVDRAAAAVDALVYSYDPYTAWWPSSWWNSAVAISTVIDYQRQTGDDTYAWMIDRTFEVNRVPFPAGEKSTDEIEGNFISRAIDDAGWWGLAWINAYDVTGDRKYLDMATTIADYMHEYWDTETCDGGVFWDRERTYKNAVTNGQYIKLTAALHTRLAGDSTWRERSLTAWSWYHDIGLIGSDGLVNDGLDECENNGQTVWTYNQGLPVGAGAELYQITQDEAELEHARRLADDAIASDALFSDGVLTESCERGEDPCDDNQKQFKGIFMRYLTELDEAAGGDYRDVSARQADTAWKHRDALNRIGIHWAGGSEPGSPNTRDWRTQASGLSALLAVR